MKARTKMIISVLGTFLLMLFEISGWNIFYNGSLLLQRFRLSFFTLFFSGLFVFYILRKDLKNARIAYHIWLIFGFGFIFLYLLFSTLFWYLFGNLVESDFTISKLLLWIILRGAFIGFMALIMWIGLRGLKEKSTN